MSAKQDTSISVRLPDDIYQWVVAKARAEDRSLNYVIVRTIRAGIAAQTSTDT